MIVSISILIVVALAAALTAALAGAVNYFFYKKIFARFKSIALILEDHDRLLYQQFSSMHAKYEQLTADLLTARMIHQPKESRIQPPEESIPKVAPIHNIQIPVDRPVMINIGCGATFDARWVNLDLVPVSSEVYPIDASKPLPFPSASVDVVYASHVLEHLAPHEVPVFLNDLYRILKPAGILRIVVPDLEQITKEYLHALELARSGDRHSHLYYQWMVIELLDQLVRQTADGGEMIRYLFRNGQEGLDIAVSRQGAEISETSVPWDLTKTKAQWIAEVAEDELFSDEAIFARRALGSLVQVGKYRKSGEPHLWMYDEFSLTQLLIKHHFISIRVHTAFTSSIASFNDYSLDLTPSGVQRKPDSLYMEAFKPQ